MGRLNPDVTTFLDNLRLPLRSEIELLRTDILAAGKALKENIKWNSPNYSVEDEDRITMRVQPPKQIQLVFHRGARVKAQPKSKLIADPTGMLDWKGNDRAVATFRNLDDIQGAHAALAKIVKAWIAVE